MNDRLYTIPQVADYLQISKSKAYDWAKKGRIPTIRIGRNVRVREKDLMEWLEKQLQISDVWYIPRL